MFDHVPTGIRFKFDDDAQDERYALGLQIVESGVAYDVEGGYYEVSWRDVFDLLEEDPAAVDLLDLPGRRDDVVPALTEAGTLSETFKLGISGWARKGTGIQLAPYKSAPVGPIVELEGIGVVMLGPLAWDVLDRIRKLNRIHAAERTVFDNRFHWAGIRRAAVASGSVLSPYLAQTIVVIPDHLKLEAVPANADGVLEVRPTFDGAPEGWLEAFDRSTEVSETYRVRGDGGELQIVLHGEVLEVLTEIKQRMPHRRAAGGVAQRVIRNPYALLGPAAMNVLDEETVERQLSEHEAAASRFRFAVSPADDGLPASCGIFVEPSSSSDESGFLALLHTPSQLRSFITTYARSLDEDRITVAWRGHRLLVDEMGAAQLPAMRETLSSMSKEGNGSDPTAESADEQPTEGGLPTARPLDFSELSDRIEGIDVEATYSIIRVPSTVATGGWVPDSDDVFATVHLKDQHGQASELAIELTAADIDAMRAQLSASDGHGEITLSSTGKALTVEQARDILDHLPRPRPTDDDDDEQSTPDEDADEQSDESVPARQSPRERQTLVALANIDQQEYVARRAANLSLPAGTEPTLPRQLRENISLLPHQSECLAWLQHLWAAGPDNCAGALLADDMGLGKTLQALAFIAAERERVTDLPPALIVAPVSLLENWKREIQNFFDDGALDCLVFAAADARRWRATMAELAPEDIERGLITQLRRGWTQGASVVVTTYDTLLNYEVSFAHQPWSIVVLDEAQAIKNPNALRTRSVWKLQSRFRLACTGTPVENSLTDLWSIFDFIQPSLLGPVNEFGRRYTKAIESGGDERRERIDELRALIEPQVKRRMKAEVVDDLPPKIFDQASRELTMSTPQLERYLGMVEEWRAGESGSRMPMIQLIRELARVNSDFSLLAETDRHGESASDLAAVNPKFAWLLETLDEIRDRKEKALVFVELRAVQRHLRRHIRDRYGLAVNIINGDTSTNPKSEASRQALIDQFARRDGEFDVMLLSPVAAGVGLNIQAANHIIHYMRHWNPAKEDQATDRAYRIGQRRPVTVYTPIVSLGAGFEFPSFDEKLDRLLSAKRELATDMLHGQDQVSGDELADLVDAVAQNA